ncbi:MAG: hypothetical protein ACR2IQ_02615 [Minisyncoccia bacterium]
MANPSPTQWRTQYKNPIQYLLCENGDFLAQEDGTSLLVLEQTGQSTSLWTDQTLH